MEEKELLLYRDLGDGNIVPFPSEINLFRNNNISFENPIKITNPTPDNLEEVLISDIYCDLVEGREYEFTAEASMPFAQTLDDGVEYYLFKDKKPDTRIGICRLNKVGGTDSRPEMYFDRIVEGNKVTAIFTPQVSGRYYLRFDNNQDNSVVEFYNVSIVEKTIYSQIGLTTFTYNAQRMSATPTITSSVDYPRCLDNDWNVNVFAEFRGERYYIRQIPSSSKDNKSSMYKHELTLYSERFILENIYLYDVLKNDDTNVIIRCDLADFAKVINRSFEKSGLLYNVTLSDEVLNSEKAKEVKDIALNKVYLSVALQEIYNQWEIPYYFEGHSIIIKDHSKWIADTVLEYGYDKSLLSVKKNNANFRKITRCSGYGSDKNIPFYYPNLSQKGIIDVEPLDSNKILTKDMIEIVDLKKFDRKMPLNGNVTYKLASSHRPILNKELSNQKYGESFRRLDKPIPLKYSFKFNSVLTSVYVTFSARLQMVEKYTCSGYGNTTWKFPLKEIVDYTKSQLNFNGTSLISSGGTVCPSDISIVESSTNIQEPLSIYEPNSNKHKKTLDFIVVRTFNISITCFLSPKDKINTDEKYDYDFKLEFYPTLSRMTTENVSVGKWYNAFGKEFDIKDRSAGLSSFDLYSSKLEYSSLSQFKTGWFLNNQKQINLSDIGIDIKGTPNDTWDNEGFKQILVSKINPSANLMPPIYRDSLGKEKFYNAKDNTYLNENGEYYDFETEWNEINQNEHIQQFEKIYPTITNIINADNIPFDEILDVAFDDNDNNEVDEEGNFLHPYFYVKIPTFSGDFGFNLFDHKIVGGNMQVSFTSGDMSACVFDIMVKTKPNADNETYEDVINPILTENGALVSGDWQQKTNGNFGSEDNTQQNSKTNSIWLILKKDDQTFGTTLPDSIGSVIPKKGDKFVLLNIEMPQKYIDSAEEKLRQNVIQYMWENNSDKWNFSIDFSRIFLKENPLFVQDLSENAKVRLYYNGIIYDFYVNDYRYEVKSNETLPKIIIGLADTITTPQSIAQVIADGVMKDVQSQLGGVAYLDDLNEQYLRKRYDETMPNNMTFEKDVNIRGNVISNSIKSTNYTNNEFTGSGFSLEENEEGNSTLIVDNAKIRNKLEVYELVINQLKAQGGTLLITSASIECNKVETYDSFYRCYFDTKNGSVYNQFEINDLAKCQKFGAITKYYWRKVIGIGNNYIDLSINECDSNSDIPTESDIIIQLGNTTNTDRQSAIELSSDGEHSPSFIMYSNINSFSLENKETTGILQHPNVYKVDDNGVTIKDENDNPIKIEDAYPQLFSYGSMYFGSRDKESNYISYEKNEQGVFEMVINAKTTFKGSKQNISDIFSDIEDDLKPLTEALESTTEIEGGLINTSVLMVKDNKNAISGGISGQSTDNIAFWSGGTLQDAIDGNCNVIIRKDGTAKIGSFIIDKDIAKIQLANGNYATMSASGIEISLNNKGKAKYDVTGITILDDNNEEKVKLIDGKVNIDEFISSKFKIQHNYIKNISINQVQTSGVIVDLMGAKSSSEPEQNFTQCYWQTNSSKNLREYNLQLQNFSFQRTHTNGVNANTPNEYYNIQVVTTDKNDNIVSILTRFAIKISFVSTSSATYYIVNGSEVTDTNKDNISWGSGNTTSVDAPLLLINNLNVSNKANAAIGYYKLSLKINQVTSTPASGKINITHTSGSFNATVENYLPKTMIGTNGFFNLQTSEKYFGAWLDDSDNYHIEAKGIINLNGEFY